MQRKQAARTAGRKAPADDDTQAAFIAYRRELHTWLGFWHACEMKVCRRARGCRGDAHACGARLLPLVPAEFKAQLRKTAEYINAGMTPREAADRAHADMETYRAALVRAEALSEVAQAAAPPARIRAT